MAATRPAAAIYAVAGADSCLGTTPSDPGATRRSWVSRSVLLSSCDIKMFCNILFLRIFIE